MKQGKAHREQQKKATPALKAMAGSCGGLMEACFLQPIDTIKTRMQLHPLKYPGILSTGRIIIHEETTRALWKGLIPFSTHLCCKYSLRFGINASIQALLADKNGHLDSPRRILAGLGAGGVEATFIVTPFEVIKIRLQNQHGLDKAKLVYTGPVDAVLKIWRTEGPLALWSGWVPTLWRNGLQQATMFWFKHAIDETLWNKQEGSDKKMKVWQSMISGFSATVPGILLTSPFDIIKTRMMVSQQQHKPPHYKLHTFKYYRGMVHAFLTISKQEGFLRLYRGLLPRMMRVPPGMAITWAVSDQVVHYYEKT